MAADKIIYYDGEFIAKFEKLKEVIEADDNAATHRFLIDNFGYLFRVFQYYAKQIAVEGAQDLNEADEDTKCELMRPLSYRQYQMIERSFSTLKEEEEHVIWSVWDFLDDHGRIYEKKVMSSAEICGFSLVLMNVYMCLAR